MVWGIHQTEAPIFVVFCCTAMEFCGISAGKKEFMVDGLPAVIGIGVAPPSRSSPLATGLPAVTCTGIAPVALLMRCVMNRTWNVDYQKRFPVIQTISM